MSRSTPPRPGGIVCPLATPVAGDGRLDETVLRDLIDALIPDLDGLFVLGSSGELIWLSDETAMDVARIAVDQVGGRIPVYVGVGDTGLSRTLARADRLAGVGADYLVVTPPFYYQVESEARIVEYFETVAERVSAPVVLYNIPQNTHLTLTPSAVRVLADHPRIVGIKDSAGDMFAFEQFLAARTGDFSVMQGRERLAAISLWWGADGVISALANFAPRVLQALAAAVRDDRPKAEILALQATVSELAAVFEQGNWLAGLKCTLEALGWKVGNPGLPIPVYDAEQRRVVQAILSRPEVQRWLTRRTAEAARPIPAERPAGPAPARPSLANE